MFQRSIFGSALRASIGRQASGFRGSLSERSLTGVSQNANACSGLRNLGMKLGFIQIVENVSLPHARSFSSYIPPGKLNDFDPGRMSGSMEYIQGLLQDRGGEMNERRALPQIESNADVVHIKLMRNNAFVTVTDSRGNKKLGISAGKLAGKGGKLTRYYGDAAAEDIGRKVRQMKTKSVVVKVNGFTFFKKKKDAILSFKDGFSNSQPNVNPIMYIEDTTRKPHNGCRLPKRRRI